MMQTLHTPPCMNLYVPPKCPLPAANEIPMRPYAPTYMPPGRDTPLHHLIDCPLTRFLLCNLRAPGRDIPT